MAITFTNTSGTGFNASNTGDGTTGSKALATPSDAGSGDLLLEFIGTGSQDTYSAYTPSLDNVTGETDITSIHNVGTTYTLDLHCLRAALSSAPTNCDATIADGVSMRRALLAMVVTGHDTGSPIRASNTASGTGTTITFPDTSSVNDGDMVLRWCVMGHEDVSQTFTGFGGTTIWNDPQSGAYANGAFLGYSVKSGSGAPGTATLTSNASREWVAMTIVVAVAGGGGGVDITAGAGALTIAGLAPTRLVNYARMPGVGELAVAGAAPSLIERNPRYAYPVGDVSAGPWVASDAGALYAAIDEEPYSDDDYIYTTEPGIAKIRILPVNDPGASSGHVLNYRIWSPVGGNAEVRLVQDTTTIAEWTHTGLPTTPTAYSQALTGEQADAITDYDTLRIEFEAT